MYELARTGQKLIEITSALVWFSYKYKFKNIIYKYKHYSVYMNFCSRTFVLLMFNV